MYDNIIEMLGVSNKEQEELKFYLKNKNIINLFDDLEKLHLSDIANIRVLALKNAVVEAINILGE